jgi:acetyl-CoA C-acetyltransferase
VSAFIIAARRTAVAPRDGGAAFRGVEVHDLAALVIRAALEDAGIAPGEVDDVVLGNALYGGGNPARMAALATGLPDIVSALTLDTQCCAGLDAILLAAARVAAGEADVVVAGGVESFSRAPLRFVRSRGPDERPREYQRPPFAPFAERDPDMIQAAAALAMELGISRERQEAFAVESHRKAQRGAGENEIVVVENLARDAFTRTLDPRICARLPVLAGDAGHGVTAATVAVEADAAAVVIVVSEKIAKRAARALRVIGGARRGGEPERPGLAPIAAANALLAKHGIAVGDLAASEVMEAFAVQAMACVDGIGLDPASVNRGGGALARGHPIGASGAILCVRLFHDAALAENKKAASKGGFLGLAAIAAAGGLGSALLLGD